VIVPAGGRADFEGMKISYQERLFYQAESFSLFPDEFLPQQEDYLADKVREVVESLPPRQREFVLSFYFEGRSYTQVALRLGVTIKKAEKLHQKAKSKLRQLLEPLV
jgi:RNA polymerase sigma factor (sigma-70 family)